MDGATALEGGDRYNGFIQIFNYTNKNLKIENRTHFYKNDITEIFGLDVGDPDVDGKPEIVTTGNWYDGTRDRLHVRVWNYTNGEEPVLQDEDNWYIEGHASLLTCQVQDTDHDGRQEIIGAGFQNDGTRDRSYWQILQYNATRDVPFVIEEDRLWKADVAIRDADFSDAMVVQDLDGDGIEDMISGGRYRMTPPAGTFLRVSSFLYPVPLYKDITDDAPVTYSPGKTYNFSTRWQDQEANLDTVILEFNGTNYTVANESTKHTVGYVWHNKSFTDLAAGTYQYKWYANGSYWNSTPTQTFTIQKGTPSMKLWLGTSPLATENLTTEWLNPVTVKGNETNLGDADLSYCLYNDTAKIGCGSPFSKTKKYANATYQFVYNTSGGQNWTSGSSSQYLKILKAWNQTDDIVAGEKYRPDLDELEIPVSESLVDIKPYDDRVVAGEAVSAYQEFKVVNNGTAYGVAPTNFTDITVDVSDIYNDFWKNTTGKTFNIFKLTPGEEVNKTVNCENVTVRETASSFSKTVLADRVKRIWDANLTVYENDVTPELPIWYEIDRDNLPNLGISTLYTPEVDLTTENVSYQVFDEFLRIKIGTAHGYSSLSEGTHPVRFVYSEYTGTGGGTGGGGGTIVKRPTPEKGNVTLAWELNPPYQHLEVFRDGALFMETNIKTGQEISLPYGTYKFCLDAQGYERKCHSQTLNASTVQSVTLRQERAPEEVRQGENKTKQPSEVWQPPKLGTKAIAKPLSPYAIAAICFLVAAAAILFAEKKRR